MAKNRKKESRGPKVVKENKTVRIILPSGEVMEQPAFSGKKIAEIKKIIKPIMGRMLLEFKEESYVYKNGYFVGVDLFQGGTFLATVPRGTKRLEVDDSYVVCVGDIVELFQYLPKR